MAEAPPRTSVEELARLHHSHLAALAKRLCQSQLDPDDLLQDLYEKLMRHDDHPRPDNERAWLSRILHNLFIDKLRRRNAKREDPLDEPPEPPPDDEVWWQRLTPGNVQDQLARLPEDQRVTFQMFAFERRSYDEIAAALRIAKDTVGSRIYRARQQLRKLLTEEWADG